MKRRRPFTGGQPRRIVHLDLSAVDVALVDRLTNWGRAVTSSAGRGGADCATGEVCSRLARLKGAIDAARNPVEEVDALDAALVERAWRSLPRVPKEMLRAWYVLRQHQAATARVLGLRRSEFMDQLVRSHWTMGSALAVLDAGVYKGGQHHPNPSADPERPQPLGVARPSDAEAVA